jgi:charged multivesicular body protein 7
MHTFQTQLVNPAIRQLSGKPQTEGDSPLLCSNLDVKVLIKFMERDRRVAVTDGSVIKLEHMEGEEVKAISEEEKGIVNVKDTYARLESQVEEIEKRIKERQSKVETALREKKREQALSYLRSRKMLDELLEKRTRSMETLHGVLIKIEQAASDVEIVKAYELSTSSLKALLSDSRLQPEHIEASMDEMQETLADADEVRRAVEAGNEGISRAAGEEEMGDEEMEAELKRLEEENEREKTTEKTTEKNKTSQAVPEQTLEPLKNNERTDPVIQQESKEKDQMEAIAA